MLRYSRQIYGFFKKVHKFVDYGFVYFDSFRIEFGKYWFCDSSNL